MLAEAVPSNDTMEDPRDDEPIIEITPISDVRPEPIRWLWPKRIPQGKLTVLAGDPGLGKSFVSIDIAARISVGGNWPDEGKAPVGNVLIASAEDGIADTIRPRLDQQFADVSRVFAIGVTVKHRNQLTSLSLAVHLAQLEAAITQHRAKLLVIDPILGFTGRTDTHKTSEEKSWLMAPFGGREFRRTPPMLVSRDILSRERARR